MKKDEVFNMDSPLNALTILKNDLPNNWSHRKDLDYMNENPDAIGHFTSHEINHNLVIVSVKGDSMQISNITPMFIDYLNDKTYNIIYDKFCKECLFKNIVIKEGDTIFLKKFYGNPHNRLGGFVKKVNICVDTCAIPNKIDLHSVEIMICYWKLKHHSIINVYIKDFKDARALCGNKMILTEKLLPFSEYFTDTELSVSYEY